MMMTKLLTTMVCIAPLCSCALSDPQQWPVADDMSNCKILDLYADSAPGVDGRGSLGELFGETGACIWASIAKRMMERGDSSQAISGELSGSEWMVRFVNSRTVLIVYWGESKSMDGERVWLVKL